jgi:hypothetical protein
MRWSTRFIIPGIVITALGLLPLALGNFNDFALEFAASFVTIGLLIFFIGWSMRKIRKGYESGVSRSGTKKK